MNIPFLNRDERMDRIGEEFHESCGLHSYSRWEQFCFRLRAWLAYHC
jgi:hypothetical protein